MKYNANSEYSNQSFRHYKNLPMQYTGIFSALTNENFIGKILIILICLLKNIDCGYTLEPLRDGSNEYPQSMFWNKNKKNRYTPAYPSFATYKSGV